MKDNTEFFNDAVKMSIIVDSQGQTALQNLTWQEQTYTIVTVGRQWDEADGRHIMAEAADGTRFELQLRRQDLIWYVTRVWRDQLAV